jgi:RNA polymerase sigma-70 factor (ECF subfamily)
VFVILAAMDGGDGVGRETGPVALRRPGDGRDEPQEAAPGPDGDLLDELLAHRPEALDHLLAAHGREILGVANMITRDRDEAADVLEDTLCIAWEKARQLRNEEALRSWLLRIATNRALSRRRFQSRFVVLDKIPDPATPDTTAPSAMRLSLLAGMAKLAPRERAAVALHYYADLPVDAVAKAMGTSPNTVKTQLREALAKLRVALDDGAASAAATRQRELGHA